jgi:hypothetical protein
MIKNVLRWVTLRLIKSEAIWKFIEATLITFARYASSQRHVYEVTNWQYKITQAQFPDLVVRYGVFQGMHYPRIRAYGSVLYPKLLGCYELELEPIIKEIINTHYSEIIDIGCAEGYYVVGLALHKPDALVYAFDSEVEAQSLCQEMAFINGVSDRVIVGGSFSTEMLFQVNLGVRSLFICDCEGCEKNIFTATTVALLRRSDVLIEVHEHLIPGTSDLLRQSFRSTHQLSIIEGLDDAERVRRCQRPELEAFPLTIKEKLLTELRPVRMQWYFFQAYLS